MAKTKARTKLIRDYILGNVDDHPGDIAVLTAKHFRISRQAVNKHLLRLVEDGLISASGNTRAKQYALRRDAWVWTFALKGLEEDMVWREHVDSHFNRLQENVLDIWHYGFTEMLNNAIDHSQGDQVSISLQKSAAGAQMVITDDGEGIFARIKRLLNLHDQRHAILELAKGKLTTDPEHHTGEGIFFSSRAFDQFAILSGEVHFAHQSNKPEDWILEREKPETGTRVIMRLSNNSNRTITSVFDKYAPGTADYGFQKTVVPVSLVRYGNEMLVSRSQAKRMLARVEKFRIVILDFADVDRIGQAFADEVFRVYNNQHPDIQLHFINVDPEVEKMIIRSLAVEPAG